MLGGVAFEQAAAPGAGAGLRRGYPRPGAGALDDLRAGDAALFRGHAARLRLLDSRQSLGRSPRCRFPSSSRPASSASPRPGLPPSRDRGAARSGEQPAAVLPGRRFLAGRGDARVPAQARELLPSVPRSTGLCGSTRWARARRGPAGLAAPLGAHLALFRRCRGAGAASRGSDAEPCAGRLDARSCSRACLAGRRRCRRPGTGGRRARATLHS